MQAFWEDIDLMNAVSRIFLYVAMLMLTFSACTWLLQRPYFAVHQFSYVGDVQQLDEKQARLLIQENLGHNLTGGFFSMNLHQVQDNLQQLSWVKATNVRRVWPKKIEKNSSKSLSMMS